MVVLSALALADPPLHGTVPNELKTGSFETRNIPSPAADSRHEDLPAARPVPRERSPVMRNPTTQISGGMRQLAVRAGMIDRGGKLLGQNFRDLIDRDVVLRRQLPDGVVAQNLMQLVGRNRQVRAASDP